MDNFLLPRIRQIGVDWDTNNLYKCAPPDVDAPFGQEASPPVFARPKILNVLFIILYIVFSRSISQKKLLQDEFDKLLE